MGLKLKVSYSQLALHLSKNQGPLPPSRCVSVSGEAETYPPGQLNQQLFSNPEVFRSAPRVSPPAPEAGTYRPLLAVNRFLLLFSKTSSPRRARPLGLPGSADIPSRSGETVYAPPRRLCQRLLFFSDFLPHDPRFYRVSLG